MKRWILDQLCESVQCGATGLGVADGARALKPFQNSPAEWPIIAALLAVCAIVVAAFAHGCTLHENPIGHRIDQPTVVVHTPPKADDDGGAR